MSAEQLREIRGDRSAQEFGEFLAELMGKERPYTAQEVWNWENGLRPVPQRVASRLTAYQQRDWLIIPYEGQHLIRIECPTCGARKPVIHETARSVTVQFSCGAAERLAAGARKVIGICSNRRKVRGLSDKEE